MRRNSLRIVIAIIAFGHLLIAQAASDFVLIDRTDPAYTVYAGIPAERADSVKAKIVNQPGQLVSFKEFAEGQDKFLRERIVIDEYASSRAIEGVVELVRKHPGTPFGLTWNGGIAFTRNDYQHAKRQFSSYKDNPEEYSRSRSNNAATDPINPKAHLGPLLGW